MLAVRAGDCDDTSILLGAMLESVGHAVRLVLTGSNPLAPDTFTHIYMRCSAGADGWRRMRTDALPHGVGAAYAGKGGHPV